MKRTATRGFAFLLTLSLLGLPLAAAGAEIPHNITLKDLKGNEVMPGDLYKDKVAVVVFWATWCIPCKKELPDLDKFYKKHKDEGVAVIAISTDTTRDLSKIGPYVSARGYEYPFLLDTESKLAKLLNPRGVLPFTVILDREGAITYQKSGYRTGDLKTIEAKVLELVAADTAEEQKPE